VYLLDANLEPVPIGVPGELYLGGAGLARGYLNRPELTAQQFIPNPFGDQPGTRLYKTGDLARYQADGNLEFLGRKDHQVKIRGFRIELGEIEATLSQHPGVRQNVIIAREDTPNEKRLVAYVVPNEGQSLTVGNLRTFLRAKLPEYMVPSLFVTLEALPLTPNGKVNRQALPAPDVARPELETTYVTARNLVEEVLTEIWIETLGLEQVGIHDNFFELGGHSLLATQIISRIHRYFRVEIPLRSLFEAPTVAGLAKTLVEYEIVPGQVATTARLIKDIDEMSADRIRAILREKKKARTEG
jgi:acyl carrier protein